MKGGRQRTRGRRKPEGTALQEWETLPKAGSEESLFAGRWNEAPQRFSTPKRKPHTHNASLWSNSQPVTGRNVLSGVFQDFSQPQSVPGRSWGQCGARGRPPFPCRVFVQVPLHRQGYLQELQGAPSDNCACQAQIPPSPPPGKEAGRTSSQPRRAPRMDVASLDPETGSGGHGGGRGRTRGACRMAQQDGRRLPAPRCSF